MRGFERSMGAKRFRRRDDWRGAGALVLGTVLLAGCFAAPGPETPTPRLALGAPDHAPPALPTDPRGDGGAPAPARAVDPSVLMGLNAPALAAKLGDPALLRRDGPAQIWQYRSTGCIVDLFLYDGARGFEVTHVELRGPAFDDGTGPACIGAMAKPRQEARLGAG